MSKELIIVESPTKAKTLTRFFGDKFDIVASYGHIRDLPKSKFGIDPEHNFKIDYVIPKDKESLVKDLQRRYKKSKELILATDPDREGEAIAWHIKQVLVGNGRSSSKESKPLKRIVFHEITNEAVTEALEHPRAIDLKMVDSQQARRVLDRIVGYKLSPVLWKKIRRGLSAGRVQSIALKFIVDREREVEKFVPVEYWSLDALLEKSKEEFKATLVNFKDKKIEVKSQKESDKILKELKGAKYSVTDVIKKELHKNPYPPFTTSTMVQAAANKLGFTSKKTMKLAQDLYEEGLITYMRTDSVNLASVALEKSRELIRKQYGESYLPSKPRVFLTKSKLAQEAHEAIRPSNFNKPPETLKGELDKDHFRLYQMIWQRMIATQMAEAVYDQTAVEIKAKDYTFRANGSLIKFAGWLMVYEANLTSDDKEEENRLPELSVGDELDLKELRPEQHFTQPPARFNEASLIKELEEKGIGRPSTYSPIMSTIQERRYVEKVDRRFQPTPLGLAVCDFLAANFPTEMDVDFTAQLEDKLDEIAHGEEDWEQIIREFYKPFSSLVEKVTDKSARVKIEAEETDEICELCGKPMVIRFGRFGRFIACSGFPECKNTKTFEEKVNAKCPDCGSDVVVRRSRKGMKFFGCSSYPKCKWMSWRKPLEPGNVSSKEEEAK